MANKLSKKKLQVLQALSGGPKSTATLKAETGQWMLTLHSNLAFLGARGYVTWDIEGEGHKLTAQGEAALASR